MTRYAAKRGQLNVLKYAHERGCKWDVKASRELAKRGDIEGLKYVHDRGCPWDAKVCKNLAGSGCLEGLRYAHENGCEWNSDTTLYAAEGHLECLRYDKKTGEGRRGGNTGNGGWR